MKFGGRSAGGERSRYVALVVATASLIGSICSTAGGSSPAQALDASFGPPATPGIVRLNRSSAIYRERDSVIGLPDGSVVVGLGRDIIKLTPSGSIDTAFDATVPFDGCTRTVDLGLDSSGRVIVVSSAACSSLSAVLVVRRLGATGAQDATFNGTLPSGLSEARFVSADGAIHVAGVGTDGACLYRFREADGLLDPGFGSPVTPGRFCVPTPGNDARARAAVRSGGGFTFVASGSAGAVHAQLTSSGTLEGGTHVLDLGSTFAAVSEIAALPGDGLLVAGINFATNSGPFVQRVDAAGALVPSFNANGEQPGRKYLTSDFVEWTLTPFGDGRFVVGGALAGAPRAIMLDSNGNTDRALESTGPVPGAIVVAPLAPATFGRFTDIAIHSGRVLVVGLEGSGTSLEPAALRTLVARSDVVGPPQPADIELYRPLQPTRILDTRPGSGQTGYAGPKPGAGDTVELQIAGRAGMPPNGVGAVALNVTATEATAPGFVSAWPSGGSRPLVSSINLERVGQTIPNLVIAPVGANGRVSLFSSGGTHLIADVLGWFPSSGALRSIPPTRVLDTRPGTDQTGYSGPKPAAASTVNVQISGRAGLPQNGVAVAVLNVTVTEASGPGFVVAWPSGSPQPLTSNVNVAAAGQTIANLVMVPVGADGAANLFTLSESHLIADLVAWLPPGSGFVPAPADRSPRLIDTRLGAGPPFPPPVPSGGTVTGGTPGIQLVNVVAVDAGAPGYLTVYPAGTDRPTASNVNVERAGQTIANAAIVQISDTGFNVFTLSSAHIIVDSFGTFPTPK